MLIKSLPLLCICLSLYSANNAQSATTHKPVEPGKIKRIFILGNSITLRPAEPSIGWHHTWGMAASAEDSDYVHLLIKDIHAKQPSAIVKVKFIAEFERRYRSYNFSNFDSVALFKPDLLIIRISENVNDQAAADSGFISYYDRMIKKIDPENKAIKVIVGGFWKKKNVNKLIEEYAALNGYAFIPNDHLSDDKTNMALGLFENAGVAKHPSDKGMRLIEESIWNHIKIYF